MHVITHRFEITGAASVHYEGFVTTTKEVPKILMPAVEVGGVGSEEPFHACHQVGVGSLHDQMEMVWHQAEGMHLPPCFLVGFRQGVEEEDAICIRFENGFAPVATIHDMIDGTGIFDSEFSCHGTEFAWYK